MSIHKDNVTSCDSHGEPAQTKNEGESFKLLRSKFLKVSTILFKVYHKVNYVHARFAAIFAGKSFSILQPENLRFLDFLLYSRYYVTRGTSR